MYKIIVLIISLFPLCLFPKEINSPASLNKAYVTSPIPNGGTTTDQPDKNRNSRQKSTGRSLSQIADEFYNESHTGLSLEEEEEILSNIDNTNMQITNKDTLWTIISNAYVKNYRKLFREKINNQ